MAPSIVTSRRQRGAPTVDDAPGVAAPAAAAPAALPAVVPATPQSATLLGDRERHLREMVRALHREITEKAENVGRAFAVEARRIHEGDAAARSIYGEASRDEVEALLEDGVPLLPMPVPPDERN